MKRSAINKLIANSILFLDKMNFKLPPWGYWNLDQWGQNRAAINEIAVSMLGWDLTDFGSGDVTRTGVIIFTLRNGNHADPSWFKPYCEKVLLVDENQVCPMHFHWTKMEDIINRGGGDLCIELYNSTPAGGLADTLVTVSVDGIKRTVTPGSILTLTPGESITLTRRLYHRFWGQPGRGRILLGEVSMVNDDTTDNRFYDAAGRFPAVDEDELPRYLMAMDYPKFLGV